MMDIYIDRLNEHDAQALFAFECSNRRFLSKRSQAGEMIIIALVRLRAGIRNY